MIDMIVIGANVGRTRNGMTLNDGGCAIFVDGILYAIAEERLSRKKHDAGFDKSLSYCLDAAGVSIKDVDLFVFSSCCEEPLTPSDIVLNGVDKSKIMICPSHHLSHAYSVFPLSQFDEAIIMVIDNEGNVIDKQKDVPFYNRSMEHMSFYIGRNHRIELLHTDSVDTRYIGIGDAYRYFTHYLGFPSYVYAGKTMGLSGYGDDNAYKAYEIFSLEDGHIKCNIENDYEQCNESLLKFFAKYNIPCPPPRTPLDNITQEHANMARWIQRETEDILVKKIDYLVRKTGIKKLCIAGGVGLNSVANAEIYKRCQLEDIFIVPAAGDSGQCIGNMFYGLYKMTGNLPKVSFNTAYLGKEYTEFDFYDAVSSLVGNPNYIIKKYSSMIELAKAEAKLLWGNNYVGHFDGRSEFGPRALGNRSILANPCNIQSKTNLNKRIKYRESFRPFAPVVLFDEAHKYFDINEERPFMLMVSKVNLSKRELIPAVTHVDGTARVQTIKPEQNCQLCRVLKEFEKLSGVPILLNTSFNIAGEPIVESPKDAVNSLVNTSLDALVMNNYLITKVNNKYRTDTYTEFITSLGDNLQLKK